MDPDACLADIAITLRERPSATRTAELREMCGNLAGWLSRGGFQPDWSKAPAAAEYFQRRTGLGVYTYLEPEEKAYPNGAIRRRGYVELRQNPNRLSLDLPYGRLITVYAGIPDTYFSIPAVYRYRGQRIRGFVSRQDDRLYFTPNAR
jgi:hypothetical protein